MAADVECQARYDFCASLPPGQHDPAKDELDALITFLGGVEFCEHAMLSDAIADFSARLADEIQ